mgnify:FL=1
MKIVDIDSTVIKYLYTSICRNPYINTHLLLQTKSEIA